MGYEKSLQNQLGKKYEVTLLNCDQYDKAILEEYKKCSKLRWMVRNLFSVIKEHDQERAEAKYLMQTLKKINSAKNYYSVVFCHQWIFFV